MALMILIKFCGFTVHLKPNNMTQSAIPGKFPEARKTYLISGTVSCLNLETRKMLYSLKCNQGHKLLIIKNCIEISPMILKLSTETNRQIERQTSKDLHTYSFVLLPVAVGDLKFRELHIFNDN